MAPQATSKCDVLVLLSGGIDSAACIRFFLDMGRSVRGLFIDYGQPSVSREMQAVVRVTDHYGVPVVRIACKGVSEKSGGLIRGRNAFLVLAALMELPSSCGTIALGIHSGTSYWDCSLGFLRVLQDIVDGYTAGQVQVVAPFLLWSKRDIWTYGGAHDVPLDLTYSCELGLPQPCGKCDSCRDLEALNAGA